jgi:hypothetical protein
MGCTNSKEPNGASPPVKGSASNSMRNNPLTEQEIQMRIDCPKQSQLLELGGVTYRYAWVSQRGYYPEGNSVFPVHLCIFLIGYFSFSFPPIRFFSQHRIKTTKTVI